jgi:hypothetical protein
MSLPLKLKVKAALFTPKRNPPESAMGLFFLSSSPRANGDPRSMIITATASYFHPAIYKTSFIFT